MALSRWVLTPYLFDSIEDERQITDEWFARYNEIRQQCSCGRCFSVSRFRAQRTSAT